jgi:DNA-binding NarL/FixJ family response regulator
MLSGRGSGHAVGRSPQRAQSIIVEIVGSDAAATSEAGPSFLTLEVASLSPAERRTLTRILGRARSRVEPHHGFDKVTAREREIVGLVCEGLGNQAIAERLEISEATVRHHLTSIYAKTGVRDRVSLVITHLRRRFAS